MSARVIFHIDINAFFASAHTIVDPTLKNKPVVVCRDVSGSVITTASYPAREFGIHSAMPLSQAKKLCDHLEVVELDFDLYQELSERFVEIIKGYTPHVQQASIDEVYADMTETIKMYKKPLDLAVNIQRRVLETLKLPISIGVAPNKFLAKMASDMKKPMGITVLRKKEVPDKLWPLPIHEMHGIGKKSVSRLSDLGVYKIGDLNQVPFDSLKTVLGNRTQNFIDKANGIDLSEIEVYSQAKSIGQSKTFVNPIYDLDELSERIMVEVLEVERRSQSQNMMGKTVSFSLRLDSGFTASRSSSLNTYINDKNNIYERVMSLYGEFEGEGGVNFISVTLSNLKPKDEIIEQLDLFNLDKTLSTQDVISGLNKEIQSDLFMPASTLLSKESK